MEDYIKDSYLMNSRERVKKVFEPSLEFLKDDFFPPSNFPKSIEIIKKSMVFYAIFSYGDDGDYEKEYFSYQDYDHNNKGHYYKGINYDFLNYELDFKVFTEELNKRVEYLQYSFLRCLEDYKKEPNFEIPLYNYLKLLKEALVFFDNCDNDNNKIFDLIVSRFSQSYWEIIETLKDKYLIIYEKPFNVLKDLKNRNEKFENEITTDELSSTIWVNVFKSESEVINFKDFIDHEIDDDYADLSFLYQKMVEDKKKKKIKHLEFSNWLYENELIKEVVFNKIQSRNGFRSLQKSYSFHREKNYSEVFKN